MSNVVTEPMAEVSATLGDLASTTPASGTARYYAFDQLGSTRGVWSASKVAVGSYGFDPYGDELAHAGGALSSLAGAYTGKPWDASAKLFHFPYRQYSPDTVRWTTRDPLGMVDGPNLYNYVQSSPIQLVDPLGLLIPRPVSWRRGCSTKDQQLCTLTCQASGVLMHGGRMSDYGSHDCYYVITRVVRLTWRPPFFRIGFKQSKAHCKCHFNSCTSHSFKPHKPNW